MVNKRIPPAYFAKDTSEAGSGASFRSSKPLTTDYLQLSSLAKRLILERKYEKAQQIIGIILFENPFEKTATALLVKIYGCMGKFAEAQEIFRLAKENGLADDYTYGCMISAFSKAGQLDRAEAFFKQGLMEAHSSSTKLYCAMITAYGTAGKPDEARALFDCVLKGNHADKQVFCAMMEAYVGTGLLQKAEELFILAIKKDCECTNLYYSLIDINNIHGKLDRARQLFETALERSYMNPKTFRLIIKINESHGDLEEAIRIFELALRYNFADENTYRLGAHLYYLAGMFDKVEFTFDSLPVYVQNTPDILINRADALRKNKDYPRAISILRGLLEGSALTEDERHKCNTVLAYALKDSGKAAESFFLFERLAKEMPVDSVHFPRAICGLVFAWHALGYGHLDRMELSFFLDTLESFKTNARGNLLEDMECAIGHIEKYFDFCK